MSTLAERIRWILEHREFTQRELGAAAGLADSFISVYFTRAQKDPAASLAADNLAALARAGRVSLEWLSTGAGSPEPEGHHGASTYPIYANLQNWDSSVREAQRRWPWLRRYPTIVEAAGHTNALLVAGPATAELVLKTVQSLMETGDPDLLEKAEAARVDAEIAESEDRYARALAMQREAHARGETPPPVAVLMKQLEKAGKSTARKAGTSPAENDPKSAGVAKKTARKKRA